MTVASCAFLISLSLGERAGVRETIMVPTTYIFRGGVGAMIVRAAEKIIIRSYLIFFCLEDMRLVVDLEAQRTIGAEGGDSDMNSRLRR